MASPITCVTKCDDLSVWFLGPTRWKERASSSEWPSDLHTGAATYMPLLPGAQEARAGLLRVQSGQARLHSLSPERACRLAGTLPRMCRDLGLISIVCREGSGVKWVLPSGGNF